MNFTYFVPDTALQTESRKWEVFRIQIQFEASDPNPQPWQNRQRQLPLQAQQCSPTTAHEEGEKQNLIHILSLLAQAKGWVSLRWKWRVSFAWKLTGVQV